MKAPKEAGGPTLSASVAGTVPPTVPGVSVVIAGTLTSVETTLVWPEESVIVAASVTMSPMSP